MPLSEEEQRVLEEIERQYHQTAAPRRSSRGAQNVRVGSSTSPSLVTPVLLFFGGVAVLVLGFTKHPLLGLLGFLMMLAGVFSAFVSARHRVQSGGFADFVAQVAARSAAARSANARQRPPMPGQAARPPDSENDPL